jgi:predicted RNase H-like nuclease (RuvC/YqgF family)
LKDSTGKEATQRIIQLQKDWKNIGNSGKAENQLWAKFRGACDAFFAAKDAENAAADKALEENYELKLAVIEKIKAFEPVDKTEGLAQLRGFSGEFTAIGHVPASKKDQVYKSYKTALDKAYEALKLNQKEREQWDFKAKLDEMLTSPDRVKQVQRERTELRKNIERLEQEINRMETNLAFFARSKGADSLRAEVAVKVQGIQEQISVLKQRLKLLPNE